MTGELTMPLKLDTVACRTDNYAYLLHDEETGRTALIDAPEAAPILARLEQKGWALHEVWITHHHGDHVEGLPDLQTHHPDLTVTGGASDANRLPPLDRSVKGGEAFDFAGHEVQVLDVSGHTVGHIAFHVPDAGAAFTADSLMALGCGRLFEGSAEMMWDSLQRLAGLPDDTLICSGHEYTQANARFARTIEPDNADLARRAEKIDAARAEGRPTVPSTLAEEKATNPFLRAHLQQLKAHLSMQGAADADVFAEIRKRKDAF
jgi:hydroxyacylglutathione hydrolase